MKLVHLTFAAVSTSLAAGAFAADYVIDPAHSSVNFTAGHLGISKTVGRFNEFEGTFSDDADNANASIVIQAASIDTNHTDRDKHLRSPDFFDVKQYPTLTFKTDSFAADKLTGVLTMHGKSKPVELDVTLIGEGEDPWGGYRKGYQATTTINRSEWGITYFIPGVPDEIEIEIQIEGIRQ
ncbi:MAG: YceI family protein [Reinekea sp.]|nr:YceI family protein [Reinekea sp.]